MRGSLALLTTCVAALLAPAGATAAVQCGDSLTNDVRLKDDLDCSALAGDALVIADDGVTVDLNGHRLIGPAGVNNGIDASDGFDDLTVKDGTIRGFDHAVDLVDNEGVTLTNLKIKLEESNDNYGVYGGRLRHLRVSHLAIDNARYAVYLYESKDAKLRHSKVTGSDPVDTYAVYIGSNAGNFSGVVDDVQANGANYGFYIYGTTAGFKVSDSAANNGGYAGFYIVNQDDPREYALNNNTANDNGEYGFYAVRNVAGSGNRARDNGTENCLKVSCG